MIGAYVRGAIVLVTVLVFQVELFSELRIFGVMPELLLGASIAGAWAAGPERGMVVAFWAGILYDLYLPTPLALSALTYILVALGVGLMSAAVADSGERPVRRLASLAAIPIGVTLFVVLGELLNEDLYGSGFVKLIVVTTLYTSVLMGPLHVMMRWVFAVGRREAPTPVRMEMVK